jgi:hypothetical protein
MRSRRRCGRGPGFSALERPVVMQPVISSKHSAFCFVGDAHCFRHGPHSAFSVVYSSTQHSFPCTRCMFGYLNDRWWVSRGALLALQVAGDSEPVDCEFKAGTFRKCATKSTANGGCVCTATTSKTFTEATLANAQAPEYRNSLRRACLAASVGACRMAVCFALRSLSWYIENLVALFEAPHCAPWYTAC